MCRYLHSSQSIIYYNYQIHNNFIAISFLRWIRTPHTVRLPAPLMIDIWKYNLLKYRCSWMDNPIYEKFCPLIYPYDVTYRAVGIKLYFINYCNMMMLTMIFVFLFRVQIFPVLYWHWENWRHLLYMAQRRSKRHNDSV